MPPDDAAGTPPPTFDILKLSAEVRKAVDELGYVHPTPVQRAVFDPVSRGVDLVVQARTGTGKTAAYGLPLIDGVVRRSVGAVQVLVLCPTRELALQVSRDLEALSKHRGTKIAAIYGGAPMGRQVQKIQEGAQIVAGTPGRVLDHLRRGTLIPKGLRAVVLDESDEMLSMGFLPQIDEILSHLPSPRQTLLFSATLPPDVQRLAETRLKNPEFVTLSGDQVGALEIQHFVYLSRGDKVADLVQLIEVENPESAIVFTNTREATKRVASALEQQGYDADWLNADLGQGEREKVMDATRKGKLRFLVATDVAARGIDISHLTHVINFDFPESAEQYVHRTGRTGRAGRTGTAISLIEPGDVGNLYYLRLTYKIRPLEKSLPSARDKKTRAETDIVQMFAELFSKIPAHPDDLALARRLFTHVHAERIVAGLVRDHLGARPTASEQAAAARRSALPRPVEATRPEAEARPARPAERTPRAREQSVPPQETPIPKIPTEPRPPPMQQRDRRKHTEEGPTVPPKIPRERVAEKVASGPPADGAAGEGAPKRAPTVNDGARKSSDATELFVNVGKKDGAKASDFYAVLQDRAGVTIDDTDYVNVRQRHTFIGIRRDLAERALGALNGATIAGREAMAEHSRSRQ
jgi:ATP-dependent RNA helicase DeaD